MFDLKSNCNIDSLKEKMERFFHKFNEKMAPHNSEDSSLPIKPFSLGSIIDEYHSIDETIINIQRFWSGRNEAIL